MTTQPRGALFAYDKILGAVARGWTTPANESKTVDPVLAEAIAHEIQDLLSAGADGDDNNLPEPFPRVHSYDPSGARRTVTVQWGGESFVSYVRYGDRSTWKEIPPINETPVERPAPSAGVGRERPGKPVECVDGCPPNQVCDWCQGADTPPEELKIKPFTVDAPEQFLGGIRHGRRQAYENVIEMVRAELRKEHDTPPASAAGGGLTIIWRK